MFLSHVLLDLVWACVASTMAHSTPVDAAIVVSASMKGLLVAFAITFAGESLAAALMMASDARL